MLRAIRRPASAVLVLSLLVAATSADAATIVQTITPLSQDLGDFTPFDIDALPFDPSVGVLSDVTIELKGSYTPSTAIDVLGTVPPTVTLTSRVFVFATNGGPNYDMPLGSQTIPAVDSGGGQVNSTGAPTSVDVTFDLADLAAFETGVAGSQLLVEYGFRTGSSLQPGGSGESDLTSFSGEGVLTYTYGVPEPGLVALTGIAALGLVRRRA